MKKGEFALGGVSIRKGREKALNRLQQLEANAINPCLMNRNYELNVRFRKMSKKTPYVEKSLVNEAVNNQPQHDAAVLLMIHQFLCDFHEPYTHWVIKQSELPAGEESDLV